MGRSAEEEIEQDRCINIIIGVGLIAFMTCLFPLAFNLIEDSEYVSLCIPHHITRIAVVAATLPLLWEYAFDRSLPRRVLYPRTILLFALLVPNAIILLLSDPSLRTPPVRLSVCFAFGRSQLFNCGLVAYIAGEVSGQRLSAA